MDHLSEFLLHSLSFHPASRPCRAKWPTETVVTDTDYKMRVKTVKASEGKTPFQAGHRDGGQEQAWGWGWRLRCQIARWLPLTTGTLHSTGVRAHEASP